MSVPPHASGQNPREDACTKRSNLSAIHTSETQQGRLTRGSFHIPQPGNTISGWRGRATQTICEIVVEFKYPGLHQRIQMNLCLRGQPVIDVIAPPVRYSFIKIG